MSNEKLSPFALLKNISAISESVATPGTAVAGGEQQWTGVGFSVSGRDFVADMKQVGEVLTPPALTDVPGVKPWVRGVANIRGRLMPIIDMQMFFGASQASSARLRRAITVDIDETLVGLLVDQVYGMRYFSATDYRAGNEPDQLDERYTSFASGAYEAADERWVLFDLLKLVQHELFLDIAA